MVRSTQLSTAAALFLRNACKNNPFARLCIRFGVTLGLGNDERGKRSSDNGRIERNDDTYTLVEHSGLC